MAQWRHSDRTLLAKLVYYGPALGGKTTNLQSLHRITDPKNLHKLLSVNTADDRTLFFDLLPFDLGEILGYKVAMKVYTVPGQVHYDATRRVVLAGTDAVIFVADSSRAREQDNRDSLENLRLNLRANGISPQNVAVLYQFNKQDLPDAASPEEVAGWLGIEPGSGFPATATQDRGVLETFMAAAKQMLERLVSFADSRTRRALEAEDLGRQVEKAFAAHVARLDALSARADLPVEEPAERDEPIVASGDDLVEQSVQTSVRLGHELVSQQEHTRRLEREAEALRRLSDALREVGASFDRGAIEDASLTAVGEMLEAKAVTLIRAGDSGAPVLERAWGSTEDPLLGFASGAALSRRLLEASSSCVVDDLAPEIGASGVSHLLGGFKAAASTPVTGSPARAIVAYAASPDGEFREEDVRFLATVAGHLSVGLQKVLLHEEVQRHRDMLEAAVRHRTKSLREAYDDLRQVDRMKDGFLSNLSHEMRTPLTAILSAASYLRDYDGDRESRLEMADSVVTAAQVLEGLIANMLRVARLEGRSDDVRVTSTPADALARAAVELAGIENARIRIHPDVESLEADATQLQRALANLLDNAAKFSPDGAGVEMRIAPARLRSGDRELPAVAVSVLDRGIGVPRKDRDRIFAPFEQGGDPMTGKPPGIGLGLHEARAIARRHGGTLRVLDREGGGSEFRLIVPRRGTGTKVDSEAVHEG